MTPVHAKAKHRPARSRFLARQASVPPIPPQVAQARRRWNFAACILLAILTLSLYSRVIHYPFTNYDDDSYVTENRHVQEGLSWQTVEWAFTATEQSNWHPLTWLSHALDFQFYGLNAAGHHATSVLWHVLNALLLFLLLARATGARLRSAAVSALFAVHPLNVESVAWIAERKNVLSMFFFLAGLGAYGWYVRQPDRKRYAVLAVLFALGLGSKPMVITLPLVLLLLDYWPLGRVEGSTKPAAAFPLPQTHWPELVMEKVPLLGLSLASAFITMIAQRSGHSVVSLDYLSLPGRVINALYSYAMYVVKALWPVHLAVLYPHPYHSHKLTVLRVVFASTFLIVVSGLVWWERTKRPYLIVGWLWFLGTMVPMIGLIQVGAQGMADRYMYLPEIGLFLMLVWGISDGAERWRLNVQGKAAIALAILAVLGVLTFRQIGYWHSSYDLWAHTLSVTQDNYTADDKMGDVLLKQGRPEGFRFYESAAVLEPYDPVSHSVMASVEQDRGNLQGAVREYNLALHTNNDPSLQAKIYANLGAIYLEMGYDEKARESSQRALQTDSEAVQELIHQLSDLSDAHPAAPRYFQVALLLQGAGRIAEARSTYQRALQVDPQYGPAARALQTLTENGH